ncbi:MAG: TRAP transporter substrate-binding protein [Candidatus Paceibacterota bacterium]
MHSNITKPLTVVLGVALVGLVLYVVNRDVSVLNATAHDEETYVIRWQIAHTPVEYFERTAMRFKDEVEDRSNGRIKVEVIVDTESPVVTVGDASYQAHNAKALENVQSGEIEMSQVYISALALLEPRFWVMELPFLLSGHEHVNRIVEGEVGEELLNSLTEHGLVGLGFTYSGGLQAVITTGQEIHSAADFAELKYRGFNSEVDKVIMATLGTEHHSPGLLYDGERVSFPEQLATGLAEAGDVTYIDAAEVFDDPEANKDLVFNRTHHKILTTGLVYNAEAFSRLPDDLQQIVKDAAKRVARVEREYIIADEVKTAARIEEKGFTIVDLSESERTALRAVLEPVYDVFVEQIGKDMVDRVIELRD